MLTLMSRNSNCKDYSKDVFTTRFDSATLETITAFYRSGVWPNPHIKENQLVIDTEATFVSKNQLVARKETNFERICGYLGLPDDPIAEPDDDDDYYYPEVGEQEDDFLAEWPNDTGNYDDEYDGYDRETYHYESCFCED